ncbi:N-acetylmuramidase domain-containing protein [Mesorhizobium sp. CAU 1741]|uniref:N-acetylmuramidase domain-containing protein n=1 Tax=Mesorhizobium sp. CAU 1741 TaxID=3140366 RepID=UPI00325AEE76
MFDKTVMREISVVARAMRVEPAALAAVAHIESGLRTHAVVNGRREPLIRFEGHYFDRRLSGERQERARQQGLAWPNAGAVANPASQASRWAMLRRAEAIDRKAARESVSWGIGQVMGAHWAWLGYADVDALVSEARDGVSGQLRLMARYIERAGLVGALHARDWAGFARGYNGPAFARNKYDARLARAYQRYAARMDDDAGHYALRAGDRGERVLELQAALSRHGHALAEDGIFGPATQQALRHFQVAQGLAADGIAGPATLDALRTGKPRPLLLAWLLRLFTNRRE